MINVQYRLWDSGWMYVIERKRKGQPDYEYKAVASFKYLWMAKFFFRRLVNAQKKEEEEFQRHLAKRRTPGVVEL